MNTRTRSFDTTWEEGIYSQGRLQMRYPCDIVVAFVFRHSPRTKPRKDVRILEVGCGTANNLWFAAREGFQVAGIDASPSAIAFERRRFQDEGLDGDLRVGDFTRLPFLDDHFDLVIDRAAVSFCGLSDANRVISEVRRVLRPGGAFHFNPYSDVCSSRTLGRDGADGLVYDISGGSLMDYGLNQVCFWSDQMLRKAFSLGWRIVDLSRTDRTDELSAQHAVHSEWRLIAVKEA